MIDLAALADQGFATAPLLDAGAVEEASQRFDAIGVDPRHPFFASSNDLPRHEARAVHHAILEIVGPTLARHLPGHRPFLASFLSKGAGAGATVAYHQDLTYTDERTARAVVVWIPLTDVDAANGALRAVVGSHRWTEGPRASGCDPLPTAPFQEAFDGLATTVPLAAGAAMAYDPGLVHGSPPNPTGRARVAIGVALAPADAELVHVHQHAPGAFRAYRVDVDYHLDQGLRHEPAGYPEVPLWGPVVGEADLARALGVPVP